MDARHGTPEEKASQALLLSSEEGSSLGEITLEDFTSEALEAAEQLAPDRQPLFGQIGFNLDDIAPGSLQRVDLTLPEGGVLNPVLLKESANGSWEPFDYDPITGTGAQFHDDNDDGYVDRAVLWIRDGGRGDRDGLADGSIDGPAACRRPSASSTPTLELSLVSALPENRDTSRRIKVADIAISDDALGSNVITLEGADASSFEVDGTELFLKAETELDYESKAAYTVTVSASDPALPGSTRDCIHSSQ